MIRKSNIKVIRGLVILAIIAILMTGCSATPQGKSEKKSSSAAEVNYPTKPITLTIPYETGGATDQVTRMLVNSMGKLPHPINIVNKPGAAGAVGYKEIHSFKPDGYNIGVTYSTIVTHKLVGNLPFNHHDFDMIIGYCYDAGALAVNAKKPWKTVDEFMAYAKQNNGKLKVSTAAPGGIWNIATQSIMKEYGVNFELVTSGGGTNKPAMELAGGHVDALVGNIAEIIPFIKSGDIRVLAVTSPERMEAFPDAPTFKELNHNKVTTVGFRAIIAPKGTPKEIITILHDAFKKGLDDSKYKEFLKSSGMSWIYTNSEDTMKYYDEQAKTFETVIGKK